MREPWTQFLLRHRWKVLALWLIAGLLGVLAAARLPSLLTNHFVLPGTDSERAEFILDAHFGQRTTGAFTLVAKTAGDAQALLPAVEAAASRAAAVLPTGLVAGVFVLDEHVVVAQIVSRLASADAKRHVDAMRAAAGPLDGASSYVTGFAAIERDLDPILQADLWNGEVLLALPVAIVLLVWTFGTLSFVLPLLLAAITIPVTLGLVFLCAQAMELTTYITNLVGLIGLGIAIDYSLLIVHRFRDELAAGAAPDRAIVRTMQTAGRAVIFSGTAVAIGLALLVLLPLPFLRGFGIGGLLIPLVSVSCSLTLLPVLLSLAGARLDCMRLLPRRWLAGRADDTQGFWPVLAHAIMRHPWPVAIASVAALVTMSLPMLTIEVGPGSRDGYPRGLPSIQAMEVVTAAIGAGATVPTSIVIDTGRAGGGSAPDLAAAIRRLTALLLADPQVAAVHHVPELPQFVDLSGRYVIVMVTGREDFGTPASRDFIGRLRAQLIPSAGFPRPTSVFVGGAPAAGRDYLGLVTAWFPPLVAAILLVTCGLLVRAFRSILLPIKAIALNLLSIGSACGLTVAAFAWGWGTPFGLIAHAQVNAWIPVMVFAMLFGLSMDYEVFLVCRMRERWDLGDDNAQAVVAGLAATGRLVTSAGLIMCAAFAGFMAGSLVELQQFGFALACAVLIDVTIVRALLLPAAMALFGTWNWYLPARLARALGLAAPARQRERARQVPE